MASSSRLLGWSNIRIMHQTAYLALLGLFTVLGCGAAKQPSAPVSSTPANRSAAPEPQRLVQISRFDCVKSGDEEVLGEFPWDLGISRWSAGGPGGSAGNVAKLNCALELVTSCARGDADIEVRIGGALGHSLHLKIERAGQQQVRFELSPPQWELHFDQSSPLTERFPYQTATFSASVTASCEAQDAVGPGFGRRLEFADDRHFTAGFSSFE